jgi:hypothetical protein
LVYQTVFFWYLNDFDGLTNVLEVNPNALRFVNQSVGHAKDLMDYENQMQALILFQMHPFFLGSSIVC